jgi:hypothetical protein
VDWFDEIGGFETKELGVEVQFSFCDPRDILGLTEPMLFTLEARALGRKQ